MILHALEQGSGPPVCLLHGLFGRAQNLATLARQLAAHFRVVSLDLRNHGDSPHAPGMTYEQMAQDVLDTMVRLDALPACMLGHSMGGKVAMKAALQAPDRISRLIVADIAPVAYAHDNARVSQAMLGLPLEPGLDRHRADALLTGAIPDRSVRSFLLQNLVPGPAAHWRIGLSEIAAGIGDIEGWPVIQAGMRYGGPTLFLAGERSDYVASGHHDSIAALFPSAVVERIADAGHWLHADQPALFGQRVAAFLSADENGGDAPKIGVG